MKNMIEIRNLTFSYNKNNSIFTDFDLTIFIFVLQTFLCFCLKNIEYFDNFLLNQHNFRDFNKKKHFKLAQ